MVNCNKPNQKSLKKPRLNLYDRVFSLTPLSLSQTTNSNMTIKGYVQYKFISADKAVIQYLTAKEGLSEESIKTEPFIANLQGDKNWMVSVKIEGDSKTYYYFLNKQDKVVLESYVENGIENVLNQVLD